MENADIPEGDDILAERHVEFFEQFLESHSLAGISPKEQKLLLTFIKAFFKVRNY